MTKTKVIEKFSANFRSHYFSSFENCRFDEMNLIETEKKGETKKRSTNPSNDFYSKSTTDACLAALTLLSLGRVCTSVQCTLHVLFSNFVYEHDKSHSKLINIGCWAIKALKIISVAWFFSFVPVSFGIQREK